MSDRTFELSRRKALIGLGTVGAASAGAGMGTSAFFSDQEEFSGNTIQAGEFSMTAQLVKATADQDGIGPDEMYPVDGDIPGVGTPISIGDLKPGDTYNFCWCITVHDNPGVVRVFVPFDDIVSKSGAEAGNVSADDIYDIDDDDDFLPLTQSEHVTVSKGLYACDPDEEDPIGEKLDGPITYESTDYDWRFGGGLGNWFTSVSDEEDSRQDGVPLGSHNGVGHKNYPDQGDAPLDDGRADYIILGQDDSGDLLTGADRTHAAYCMEITVDEDAGNELQGAELEFDLQFLAEQHRHNDRPFYPGLQTRPQGDLDDWT